MPQRLKLLLFSSIFLFRLYFGLGQSYWTNADEKQTYLTGLKYYTTGEWPYYGPEAAGAEGSFHSQIPGALEGLVIGLPLRVWPIPESPFVLANLLNAGGILLLAWYICRRMPGLSLPWLCAWITVAPWSLYYSHVSNMSYLYFSGVLFFIGFLESLPAFSLGWISAPWANAMMGFSTFWIMQFHLSYVYLFPLAAYSLAVQLKNRRVSCLLFFALGALPPFLLALPTYLRDGWGSINSHSGFLAPFFWPNMAGLFTLLARYLSLACFELPRFLGDHLVTRMEFLIRHSWLAVPAVILWIGGLLQPFVLLFCWFKKDHSIPRWRATKWLSLGVFAMVYVYFWFTIKLPSSHIYLVLLPQIMIYSCYCWIFFAGNPRWRTLAKLFVILGAFFQLGYAAIPTPRNSFFAQRGIVVKAIQEKNYHLVGERTPGDYY